MKAKNVLFNPGQNFYLGQFQFCPGQKIFCPSRRTRHCTANYQRRIEKQLKTDRYVCYNQRHTQGIIRAPHTNDLHKTHGCVWILNADKHLRILQSKHLQTKMFTTLNSYKQISL